MKDQNQSFSALVAKMESLKENEEGKLKGGIAVLNSENAATHSGLPDYICGTNIYKCGTVGWYNLKIIISSNAGCS